MQLRNGRWAARYAAHEEGWIGSWNGINKHVLGVFVSPAAVRSAARGCWTSARLVPPPGICVVALGCPSRASLRAPSCGERGGRICCKPAAGISSHHSEGTGCRLVGHARPSRKSVFRPFSVLKQNDSF